MKLNLLAVFAALLLASVASAEWSWGGADTSLPAEVTADSKESKLERRSDDKAEKPAEPTEGETEGRNYAVNEPIYSADSADDIVDHILSNKREGRNLGEFDEVYADPSVKQALDNGDDVQARNLIKDKLCMLGLMSCEYEQQDTQEKRPLYSSIYGQGVPPPPPPHRGSGPYGPPRPMPPPGRYGPPQQGPPPPGNYGPPRKVGYEGPQYSQPSSYFGGRPQGPFLQSQPPSGGDGNIIYTKPPPGAVIYGSNSKPPGPIHEGGDAPYNFEHIVKDKIEVADSHQNSYYAPRPDISLIPGGVASGTVQVSSAATSASLQQHVHHHFHHVEGEGAAAKAPIVPVAVPVPVPVGSGGFGSLGVSSGFSPSLSNSISNGYDFKKETSQSSSFTAGFNGASQGGLLAGNSGFGAGNGGYGKPSGYNPTGDGLGSFGSNSGSSFGSNSGSSFGPNSGSSFGSNSGSPFGSNSGSSFGSNSGSFGSSGLGQSQSGFTGQSQSGGYHSSNPDYYKKELQSGSGSGSQYNSYNNENKYGSSQYQGEYDTARQQHVDCVCVPYNQCPAADRIGRKDDLILAIDPRNLAKDIEALGDDAGNSTVTADDKESSSKKVKRDVSGQTAADKQSVEGEANEVEGKQNRQFENYPLPSFGLSKRKVLPTFGVSFGLPYPSGAYQPNAFGQVPAQNPNFGAISPNGLNLGLVNVNPLVSLQVSKTEYGEKVVKPLVNLHVTPNANILQKVGELFKKKQVATKHEHYHHHEHFHPEYHYGHDHDHDHDLHHHDLHHYESHPEFIPTGPHHFDNGPEIIPSGQGISHFPHGPEFLGGTGPGPLPFHHHSQESHFHEHHTGPGFVPTGPSGPAFGVHPGLHSFPPSGGPSGEFYPPSGVDFGHGHHFERSLNVSNENSRVKFQDEFAGKGYADGYNEYIDTDRRGKSLQFNDQRRPIPTGAPGRAEGGSRIAFPNSRRRRSVEKSESKESVMSRSVNLEKRQSSYGPRPVPQQCRGSDVCCRRPIQAPQQQQQQLGRCGTRNANGITGRIKNPVYIDGDSEFGEYPWHVGILKKDPKESVYVCGGTLIDAQHIITAAHCIKTYQGFDLRVRLGEWDVNHDVEFFPYIERDVVSVHVHPEYYAGTLDNDLAVLKLDQPVDFTKNPHISPACMPDKFSDFTGARCWTTGWGKDAFGDYGKYQNILKEVDVPIIGHQQCQTQLRQTRLGYSYKLNPGFICAGGEEGKDACKGDGGGPLVCERNGIWNVVGVVSWGIGCGQVNVPGVYVRVAHYLDWINQITHGY